VLVLGTGAKADQQLCASIRVARPPRSEGFQCCGAWPRPALAAQLSAGGDFGQRADGGLIIEANPFMTGSEFHPDAVHRMNIDNDGDLHAAAFSFTFSEPKRS
jgi:hypothetical protein